MQLGTYTQAYIWGNSVKCFDPFGKHHDSMLSKIIKFTPMNLYLKAIQKMKAIGTKTARFL